ncbi:MAG TPA: FGGY-family carbohydrate kinase [Thermodesulfobacteriota bacterium]|nr:FGGY-family carbohydrate kinase [Thermodesulfobacteriota bacterium]
MGGGKAKSDNDRCLIGVDLGTTNLKAGLFNSAGAQLALSEANFAIDRPLPGRAEQDPEEWWHALRKVFRDLIAQVPGARISAIGICSQVGSQVFVDANMKALTKVILWQDQRSANVIGPLNEKVQKIAGSFAPGYSVDTTSVVSRAEWARVEQPSLWKETKFILSPKDYLNLLLTGEAGTDALSSIGLVDDSGHYLEALSELVPNLIEILPPLLDFRDALGSVRDMGDTTIDSALKGAVVAVATMDAFGNLFGSGATSHGEAIEVAGTCEIVGVLSHENHPTKGVVTFPPVDGIRFHAGPTKSGGSALQWFSGIVGLPIAEVVERAEKAPPGSGGLIFLPYLEGERAPIWDDDVRGVFFGLSAEHGLEHLCRAVLEGVAFSARHLLEEIDKASGFRSPALRISGGGSRSDMCCQIRADISGRSIERIHVRHSGVLGAALIAAVASGLAGDLKSAAAGLVHVERVFTPHEELRSCYDNLYSIYRQLYPLLMPANSELAAFKHKDWSQTVTHYAESAQAVKR